MPERIQLRRTPGWRKPDNTVVVSRPGRWGNPYPVGTYGLETSLRLFTNTMHGIWEPLVLDHVPVGDDRFENAYEAHCQFIKRLGSHPMELAPAELHGRNLACWCPLDQPCHADVLLRIANGQDA
jgi:hypothetical protein